MQIGHMKQTGHVVVDATTFLHVTSVDFEILQGFCFMIQ